MRKLFLGFLVLFLVGNAAGQNGTDVKNVSLSLEFNLSSSDQVYFDGEEVSTGEFSSADFPYIVSQGGGYVSGIVADTFIRAERSLNEENRITLQREPGKSSFLVPLTSGSQFQVERREELIVSNQFLNQLMPSFGFFMPEEATVKTALDPNVTINSDLDLDRGTYTLEIRKTGENRVQITEKEE